MRKNELKQSFSVEEIHKLREEHYENTKDLSSKEVIEKINKKAGKFKKGLNKNDKKKRLVI